MDLELQGGSTESSRPDQRESDFCFKADGVNTPEKRHRSGYPVIAV